MSEAAELQYVSRHRMNSKWSALMMLHKLKTPAARAIPIAYLQRLNTSEILSILPHIISLALADPLGSLRPVVLGYAAKSMHVALRISWLLKAAQEDSAAKTNDIMVEKLIGEVETFAVNGEKGMVPLSSDSAAVMSPEKQSTPDMSYLQSSDEEMSYPAREPALGERKKPSSAEATDDSSSEDDAALAEREMNHTGSEKPNRNSTNSSFGEGEIMSQSRIRAQSIVDTLGLNHFLLKAVRCEYFNRELWFMDTLSRLSRDLRRVFPVELRTPKLRHWLEQLNMELLASDAITLENGQTSNSPISVYLPLGDCDEQHHRVLRLVHAEAVVLSSAEKTPFMVHVEIQQRKSRCDTPNLHHAALWRPRFHAGGNSGNSGNNSSNNAGANDVSAIKEDHEECETIVTNRDRAISWVLSNEASSPVNEGSSSAGAGPIGVIATSVPSASTGIAGLGPAPPAHVESGVGATTQGYASDDEEVVEEEEPGHESATEEDPQTSRITEEIIYEDPLGSAIQDVITPNARRRLDSSRRSVSYSVESPSARKDKTGSSGNNNNNNNDNNNTSNTSAGASNDRSPGGGLFHSISMKEGHSLSSDAVPKATVSMLDDGSGDDGPATLRRTRSQLNQKYENGGWVVLTEHPTPIKEHGMATPFGEFWAEKEERLRKASPYSHLANWKLLSVIVKSGDDCRQEAFAMHLIMILKRIYEKKHLPLYLRPFKVVVLSADCGLIETVTDALSLTSIKKRSPNFTTLRDYFLTTYGHPDSPSFRKAVSNFIESMAAYSVVSYILQIKDRHNGNIMLDAEGHILHIDFGFFLSNSPGGVNWENAPFKLNQEFVEVMGGPNSDGFLYFSTLCNAFFIEIRRKYKRLLMPIQLMLKERPSMPCLIAGKKSIERNLFERLQLQLSPEEAEKYFNEKITESLNSWRTAQYDVFQRWSQGIL